MIASTTIDLSFQISVRCNSINLGYKDCTKLRDVNTSPLVVNAFSDNSQTLTIELMVNFFSFMAKRLIIKNWV